MSHAVITFIMINDAKNCVINLILKNDYGFLYHELILIIYFNKINDLY